MGAGRRFAEVLVRFPGRETIETVHFEADRPLQEQLEGHCALRGVHCSAQDNQVLVVRGRGAGDAACVVLGDAKAVCSLPVRTVCRVLAGVDVAKSQLDRVEDALAAAAEADEDDNVTEGDIAAPTADALPGNLSDALGDLLRSMRSNAWFAEEIVAQEGMQVLLDVLAGTTPLPSEDAGLPEGAADSTRMVADLAAACVSELVRYENGFAWCEQGAEDALTVDVFAALLWAVVSCSCEESSTPRAALGLLLFFLIELPSVAVWRFHEAAGSQPRSERCSCNLYMRLMELCASRQEGWVVEASTAVVCGLVEAARGDQRREQKVRQALKAASACCGNGALELLPALEEEQVRRTCLTRHLVMDTLAATAQAACGIQAAEASAAAAEGRLNSNEAGQAESTEAEGGAVASRCAMLETRLHRAEEEVRRMNLAMRKMAPMVVSMDSPVLKQSLEAIVRFGFDSVPWAQGYTALHFAAECCSDMAMVEMLCHLATDLEARDDRGRTPVLCAQMAGKHQVAQLIENVRLAREERTRCTTTSFSGQPPLPTVEDPSLPTLQEDPSLPTREEDEGPPVSRRSTRQRTVHFAPEASAPAATPRSGQLALGLSSMPGSGTVRRGSAAFQQASSRCTPEVTEALREMAAPLRGYLYKYPTSGVGFWRRAKKHYFVVTYDPLSKNGGPGPDFSFSYWDTQQHFEQGRDPTGTLCMQDVVEVVAKTTISEAALGLQYREGENEKELVVVAKDTRGLPNAQDAKKWTEDLNEFIKELRSAHGMHSPTDLTLNLVNLRQPRANTDPQPLSARSRGDTIMDEGPTKRSVRGSVGVVPALVGMPGSEGPLVTVADSSRSIREKDVDVPGTPPISARSRASTVASRASFAGSMAPRGSRTSRRATLRLRVASSGDQEASSPRLDAEAISPRMDAESEDDDDDAAHHEQEEGASGQAGRSDDADVSHVEAVEQEFSGSSMRGETTPPRGHAESVDGDHVAAHHEAEGASVQMELSEEAEASQVEAVKQEGRAQLFRLATEDFTQGGTQLFRMGTDDFSQDARDRNCSSELLYEADTWTVPLNAAPEGEVLFQAQQSMPRLSVRRSSEPTPGFDLLVVRDSLPRASLCDASGLDFLRADAQRLAGENLLLLERVRNLQEQLQSGQGNGQVENGQRPLAKSSSLTFFAAGTEARALKRERVLAGEEPMDDGPLLLDEIGPLREQLETFGREQLFAKLQQPPLMGGLSLCKEQAELAIQQIVASIVESSPSASSPTGRAAPRVGLAQSPPEMPTPEGSAAPSSEPRHMESERTPAPKALALATMTLAAPSLPEGQRQRPQQVPPLALGRRSSAPPRGFDLLALSELRGFDVGIEPKAVQGLDRKPEAIDKLATVPADAEPEPEEAPETSQPQQQQHQQQSQPHSQTHSQPEVAGDSNVGSGKTKGKGKKGSPPPGTGKGPTPPAAAVCHKNETPPIRDEGQKGTPATSHKKAMPAPPGRGGPPQKGGKGPAGKGPAGKGPPPPAAGGAGAKAVPAAAPAGKGPKGPPPGKGGKGKGKGKGKVEEQLRKPKVTPGRPMKPIWWTRFLFGKQLKEGSTIWDRVDPIRVELPVALFEIRFSKNASQVAKKPAVTNKEDKEQEKPKALRVVHDPNLIVGKEAALRSDMPRPEVVAKALATLDPLELPPHRLAIIREHVTPTPAQVAQLEELRRDNPDVPFATPEEYMWHISRVPAYAARIDCWSFLRGYEERATHYATTLAEFQRIMDSFMASTAVPKLLALVLAAGNHLMGGTPRGQADGFDFETLGKLDTVKDAMNPGQDIRHFLVEIALLGEARGAEAAAEAQEEDPFGDRLVSELSPVLRNVHRSVLRDSEGTMKVAKNVRVVLEDIEECLRTLLGEFEARHENLQTFLQYSEDPADPMRLILAEQFASAKLHLDRLSRQSASCRASYTRVMEYVNHPGMKSSEFLLLWDNLLVPSDLMLNKPEAVRQKDIIPRFCKPDAIPSVEDLFVLWDLGQRPQRQRRLAVRRKSITSPRLHSRPQKDAEAVERVATHWRSRAMARRRRVSIVAVDPASEP